MGWEEDPIYKLNNISSISSSIIVSFPLKVGGIDTKLTIGAISTMLYRATTVETITTIASIEVVGHVLK